MVNDMPNVSPCPPPGEEISPDVLLRLLNRLQQTHIPLHSLHILLHDRPQLEAYYAPCQKGQLHRMFSVSKNLTALAVLKLCETDALSLDDPVCRYFPEYTNESTHPWIRQTTLRHMLMMRSCHASTTYKFDMTRDWVESFFTVVPTHRPGTVFHYDTSASHTLCALVEKRTGQPLLDYLREVMLEEMGWSRESYMLTDPFGHSLGGSGLMATAEDLVLLGRFLMQEGCWNGRQLLRRDLIAQALAWHSATAVTGPITGECQGYGYSFWQGEYDARICYGMGGQLILCYPAHGLLVVTTADTQGMNGGNQLLYDALHQILLPELKRPSSPAAESKIALQQAVANLCLEPLAGVYVRGCAPGLRDARPSSEGIPRPMSFLDPCTDGLRIRGKVYQIRGSEAFSQVSLELSPDTGVLHYTLKGIPCRLSFGLHEVIPDRFPICGMFCASSGMWLEEHSFYIRTHLLDTSVGSIHFQFYFGEEDVTIYMKKQEESLFGEYSGHLYGTFA